MAQSLTEQFDRLIEAHGLINLSVSRTNEGAHTFWSASAQSLHQGERICGQAIDKAPQIAIARAIADLSEQRQLSIVIPELEAA